MTLFSDLGTLETAGLIRVAKVEPDLEYLFRHALVQDTAYASLLENDRKRLHLAVGDAIETLYPERRTELAAILAKHFREAGEEARSLSYFLIAGDEALSAYANQEAEILYRSALDLSCCTDTENAWLYSGLGEALYRQSRLDEALQMFWKGIEIYKLNGDSDGVARLYARVGRVEWYVGDRPEGLRICLEGLELVKDAPDSRGKATLMHETARAYYFNGMSEKALELCRKTLDLAEQLGAVHVQADTLATLGILSGISAEESLGALRKAVELSEANQLYMVAMRAHHNLGTMLRTWLGDNETAMEHFRRGAELGQLRGVAAEELMATLSYVGCLYGPGRLKEIEAALPHLEELAGKISNPGPSIEAIKFTRAALVGYRGDWKSALVTYRECLEEARRSQNLESELNLINELTWILLELNRWGTIPDLSEVEALLLDASKHLEQDDSNEKMWIYPCMAILRVRQGRLDDAHHLMKKSQAVSTCSPSIWNTYLQGIAHMEIACAEKNWSDALAAVEETANQEARHGFRLNRAKTLLTWADIHIQRGEPADHERAQALLWESLALFNEMEVGYFPEIIKARLKEVQTIILTQTLDHEKMTKDLKKARLVQESLLPETLPDLPGWELSVALQSAGETSGDFYDYLPLSGGKMGILIADVTDKGTSAALYMALSRSLWRTFAAEYPDHPNRTMELTNRRILADTHGGLIITLFYGILDPQNGDFSYCSAGHYPAYLLRSLDGSIEELARTGIPLGVMEETSWNSETIRIEPGDTLVLYTDGMTDALNDREEFFGQERMKQAVQKYTSYPPEVMKEALLADVRNWIGQAQQYDDITLLVIGRQKAL
jgi:serine phosphatase RsbU (regulator of sigma subunit)/tetratricopeptide (TPR) repeat protein